MKIAITGATGFIGKAVSQRLFEAGHQIFVITRDWARASQAMPFPCHYLSWSSSFGGMDAMINLAGASVAGGRWTEGTKKEIYDSRVLSTQRVVEALGRLKPEERPKVLISASAVGFYGDRGDEILDESSLPGEGFLARVTADWEAVALEAEALGVRLVLLRLGVVLGAGGGALARMQPVVLGTGKQWMSWVHIADVVRFIEYTLQNGYTRGVYNLTSPKPVTNREFTRAYARARGVPLTLVAPAFALRAALGEMASVVLDSQRVMPSKIQKNGFEFLFENLETALGDIHQNSSVLDDDFRTVQFVAKPLDQVFSFFSRAENLEEITPPWLKFHIRAASTPDVQEHTLIDYMLKIHGLPVRWQSRIDRFEPGREFVDVQVRGPYAKWQHVHRFSQVPGGTMIYDHVTYRVPGGLLGRALLGRWIRRDIEKIFLYRKEKIESLLSR